MSISRLPREMGIWVRCNGTDTTSCPEKLFTANITAKANRAHAVSHGWGRGLRTNRKRRDLCPACLAIERQLHEMEQASKVEKRAARNALKQAIMAGAPVPKKTRRKKASTDSPPGTGSPSEVSVRAQAT